MPFDYSDTNLDRYCGSATQKEALDAVRKHGSFGKAAKALGQEATTISKRLARIKTNAKNSGYIPENGMTEPFDPSLVHQKSTVHVKDGQVVQYWARLSPDEEKRQEAMKAAVEALTKDLPKYKPIKAPKNVNKNLCNLYVITDFHLGLLAQAEETKDADWDIKKAEALIIAWFDRAIELSPAGELGIYANLSDFTHADGIEPLTPASKHVLDVDSRFHKVVRAAIRIDRYIINKLLGKYKQVHCMWADANHDPTSAVWQREFFAMVYENEKRVTVDTNPNPYNAYEWGKVALFFHHGHKRKVANIDTVFVGMYRELFGRTEYHYAHMGHLHSVDLKETNLMIVEQHRTLAPADAYAARGGWLSGRDAKVITYHKEYGEVSRLTISPAMLK